MSPRWCALIVVSLCFGPLAHADIAVLLLEATGSGAARYTAAGHSAVYLSGICPDTPVRLRICGSGEAGSVISNYIDFGEDGSPEWNVAPANIFFYGTEDAADKPLFGDPELLALLRERYLNRYLQSVCSPEVPCGSGHGQWRDMVGATFMRDIYSFRVKTTPAEDREIVEDFNRRPNINRYSGFTRNCADFTRTLLNRFMPGSARADRLNDFGMTSPKAVARSFSRYAKRHRELGFSVERYSQIQGPIRRSLDNRNGTEVGFRAKKWSIPLLVARSHMLGYFIASYYLTAWFNPEREYQAYRVLSAPANDNSSTPSSWSGYKTRYAAMLKGAIPAGIFEDEKDVDRYFRVLESESQVELAPDGSPTLRLGNAHVGLTPRTLVQADAPGRQLAERLLLAKIGAALKAPKKNRPALAEMASNWELLAKLTALRIDSSGAPTLSSSADAARPLSSTDPQSPLQTGQ